VQTADLDDCSAGNGSTSTRASFAFKCKFFRLGLLRIKSRAVRSRQKCIGRQPFCKTPLALILNYIAQQPDDTRIVFWENVCSTLIDISQYLSYDNTRTDTVTLLLSVLNSPPAKVELVIQTACISASSDRSCNISPQAASPNLLSQPLSQTRSFSSFASLQSEASSPTQYEAEGMWSPTQYEAEALWSIHGVEAHETHYAQDEEDVTEDYKQSLGSVSEEPASFSSRPAVAGGGVGWGEMQPPVLGVVAGTKRLTVSSSTKGRADTQSPQAGVPEQKRIVRGCAEMSKLLTSIIRYRNHL